MSKFKPTLKSDKIVISIRLDTTKLEKIDEIADCINISRNELINQCLDYSIKNLDFKKKNKL